MLREEVRGSEGKFPLPVLQEELTENVAEAISTNNF